MSRRYAEEFWQSVLYAFITPVLFLFGQGERVRAVMTEKIQGNRDVPDSPADMALGLYLLFWAFFLQLVGLVLEALGPQQH